MPVVTPFPYDPRTYDDGTPFIGSLLEGSRQRRPPGEHPRPRAPGPVTRPIPGTVGKVPRDFAANDPSYALRQAANQIRKAEKFSRRGRRGRLGRRIDALAMAAAVIGVSQEIAKAMARAKTERADQQDREYAKAIENQVMGGLADARARTPDPYVNQVIKASQPKYLSQEQLGQVSNVPKSDTARPPLDQKVRGNQPNPAQFPAQTPPPAPPPRPSTAGRSQPQPAQQTPFLDQVAQFIDANIGQLLDRGLAPQDTPAPSPRPPPSKPPPKTSAPALPFDAPYSPPGTNPLTPLDARGVPFAETQRGRIELPESAKDPQPDPAEDQCKKGGGPKKTKGQCGQGFFRQMPDGSVKYKYWSRTKCR